MKKITQYSFVIIVRTYLISNLLFILPEQYDNFICYSDSGKRILLYLLRGYQWQILFILLALIALFKHTPNGYLFFMMHPFYLWTTFFLEHAYHSWLGVLIPGLIIPLVFNLNFIRKTYITDNRTLVRKLILAIAIGTGVALLPLLRYWIL